MNDSEWFAVFALGPVACGGLLLAFVKYFKAAPTQWAWLRLVAGNALVLLFVSSLVFLGGEIYYRYIYDASDAFNYTKTSERWQARYYQSNALGLRGDLKYGLRIPLGKRRIIFLGDSFTAGHGIKDVEDRFANRIRKANPQWEVPTLAGLGLDTGDEIAVLERIIGLGFQLDQVVLVYCLNDISDIVPEWNDIVARIYDDRPKQNWLVRNSYFANTIYYRLKARLDPNIANYYDFLSSAYRGPLWEQQKNRLRTLRNLVKSHGGNLLVVTFPFLHAPLDDTYPYRFVHRQLEEFWRELNVPHLDLLPVYQGLPPRELVVNQFDPHPNELAHGLAADPIQKFLDENLTAGSEPSSTNRRAFPTQLRAP